MRILRYIADGRQKSGILIGSDVHELVSYPFHEAVETGAVSDVMDISLLPPCEPSKIIAIGLNYKEHAKELNMALPDEPLIFLKPKSSVIASGNDIVYPDMSRQVDYEGEIGVVIKKRAKNVAKNVANDYILGYTCINDVTARDLQRKDVQFTRSKSFDTFCPVGPCIQTELDPMNVRLCTYVNGELRQETNTNDMIFDVYHLVSFVSSVMTLFPGDIITTGTPKGVASVERGDEIVVEIENIGRLKNRIV